MNMVSVHDRGFNYGDGVFETMRVRAGRIVWQDLHWRRLRRGCEVLGIALPHEAHAQAIELAAGQSDVALKLVVTRGMGGRGYAPAHPSTPTVAFSLHELPSRNTAAISLRWCKLRLAQQPILAGIKHLNRLENVLARAEWDDPAVAEGLLCDVDGRVICATAANLFLVRGGRVFTPRLDRCGVAGVTRAWLMEQVDVEEIDVDMAAVESADELFLTSSLRGILPVARLELCRWAPGPVTRHLQGLLPA